MKELTVTKARPKLAELVGKSARGKRFVISQKNKRGQEKAVLIGFSEFNKMKRQTEFRELMEETRKQARAAMKIEDNLDDDTALELADRVVHEIRSQRRASSS